MSDVKARDRRRRTRGCVAETWRSRSASPGQPFARSACLAVQSRALPLLPRSATLRQAVQMIGPSGRRDPLHVAQKQSHRGTVLTQSSYFRITVTYRSTLTHRCAVPPRPEGQGCLLYDGGPLGLRERVAKGQVRGAQTRHHTCEKHSGTTTPCVLEAIQGRTPAVPALAYNLLRMCSRRQIGAGHKQVEPPG